MMTKRVITAAVIVAGMVTTVPAAMAQQQEGDGNSGSEKVPAEVANELVGQDRVIQRLEKQLNRLELEAEIQKLSNEIKKANLEHQRIGKEPENESEDESDEDESDQEDVVYYPPPSERGNSDRQGGSSGRQGNDEDDSEDESPSSTKSELKKASIVRTFRPAGNDQREAVIRLRSSVVPVTTNSSFGDWKVSTIQSESVTFEHDDSGESVVVGF